MKLQLFANLDRRLPPRRLLFYLLSLIVLLLAATLASQRAVPRINALFHHLKPQRLFRRSLVTSSNMIPDKYRNPPQAPPLFTATAESILADTKKLNETSKSVLDKVVADVSADKATFANVQEPILMDDNLASPVQRILTFYQHVSPKEELREASNKAEVLMDDFNIESQMREDVFKLVDAAFATRESQNLDPERLHVLEKVRKGYVRNGLELPAGPKRDRFKEIQKRLSQLCIQCQKNLNEEKGAIWFTPAELDGVPSDDIDIDSLEKGMGENEGKVKLTFKYNHYFPTLKYARDENTRRRYVIAESNKVSQIHHSDLGTLTDIVSQTTTFLCSRRSSSYVMRVLASLASQTTLVRSSARRWPRTPRLSTTSWETCGLAWLRVARRSRPSFWSTRRKTAKREELLSTATSTCGTHPSTHAS